ncbi:MAG: RHS repeat protein [Candidatus Rokubacteria bacterium]|nr:RHS repeat protein [Candidatus Rokubacteria bacterium]
MGATETSEYDGNGNLTRHTDRKRQVATFSYDALDRRTTATYIDATVSYTYDLSGRLVEVTDSAGGSIFNCSSFRFTGRIEQGQNERQRTGAREAATTTVPGFALR